MIERSGAKCWILALLGLVGIAPSCASKGGDGAVASLSVTSADPLTTSVGQTVTVTVHAVTVDGTSADVSDRASCALAAGDPPGALAGRVFTASKPGTTDIRCTFAGATGALGITVAGALRTTVAKVQNGDFQQGSTVEIAAVVFGIDPDGEFTNFWAQDPGGGPRSGIYFRDVRRPEETDGGAALPTGAAPPVAEGDAVTVTGTYAERRGRSIINWTAVHKTGSRVPKPAVVPVASMDPAVWDGCLVAVESVKVTRAVGDGDTWEVADATGAKALVDTLLHPADPRVEDRFDSITGPLFVWLPEGAAAVASAIAPRRAADLVGKGGITPGAPTTTTIPALQAGAVPEGTTVTLERVVVTSIDPLPAPSTAVDAYAQDPAGGARSGIYLRDLRKSPGVAIAVGDEITLKGEYAKKDGRKVVNVEELTRSAAGKAPRVVTAPLATIKWDEWESALVRVLDVRVTNVEHDPYTWEGTDGAPGGTAKVLVDNALLTPALGDAYAGLAGVVFYPTRKGEAVLVPRSRADLGSVAIADLQSGRIREGTAVHIDGAVVYALRPGPGGVLDFWAQDRGGGPRSGIAFRDVRPAAGGTPSVVVSDVVAVDGTFALRNGAPTVRYDGTTKVGTAAPVGDAVPLATLTDPALAAPWAGCLVKVADARVTVPDDGALGFRVVPVGAGASAPSLLIGSELTGPVTVTRGDTFPFITGVVYVTGGAFELWPRAAADLVR